MARIELSNIGGGGTTLSLTTTGTSGASTLAGSVLNIPVYQGQLTLTTTGTSGAATLSGTMLNIPNYATGGNPAGSAGQVQFNSTPAGSFAASANLAWDNTAVQLNINAPLSPTGKLNVKGSGATSSTVNTRLTDSGNAELLKVLDNGSTNIGANFNWDNVNGRLGLGTSTPNQTLEVSGAMRLTGTAGTAAFMLGRNSAGDVSTVTLTTTGTSGAATLVGNTLNIPQYSGGGGGSPAGSTGEIQYNNAGAFGASANLAWDNTNVRLNIGAPSTPTARLNVRGGGTTSATSTQVWTNSGNTELMRVTDNGNLGIGTSSPSSQLSIGIGTINTEMLMEHRAANASTITFNTTAAGAFAGAFLGTGSSFAFGTYKANQCVLQGGSGGVAIRLANQSTSGFHIYAGNSNLNNSLLQFFLFPTTGNILTQNGGTFTDNGYRFDIISASSTHGLRVRAPNSNSGTDALLVQNTTISDLYRIEANGKISYLATNTAAGTTGAQTINRPSGTVNFAAGATALVVTNSLCTTSSIVLPVIRTNDATAQIKNVVPATGSFTINLSAAATAETSVGFFIIN